MRRAMRPLARPAGYLWTSPNTMIGLCFLPIALLTGGKVQRVSGVIEIYGGFAEFFLSKMLAINASALTLGHVVLGQSRELLDHTRKHERVHVRQYQVWGPAFLPAYFLSSAYAWYRGERPYLDNIFEREAYAIAP